MRVGTIASCVPTLELDPATAVLHYAQEIFEGIKAYRHADGSVWAFRPEKNAERFRNSARRLALPELDTETFVNSLKALVSQDVDWVPTPRNAADESSLYLRPFMIASEPFLGVRPSTEVDYFVIASPAAAYFRGGVQPHLAVVGLHAGRGGRHRGREVRGQLRGIAGGAEGGGGARLRPGCVP